MTKWQARGVWAALGLILSLIHEPFGIWPAAFGVFWAVFYLVDRRSLPTHAFANGWYLGFGYFAGTFNWLVHPFLVEPEVWGWAAPFALGAMAGGLALFWGGAFAMADRIAKLGLAHIPILIVCISGFEALRGVVLTGLPWGMIAQGFVDTGLGQALAFVGPFGLALLVLLLSALPLVGRLGIVWAVLIFAVLEFAGQYRMAPPTAFTDTRVRLLQTNNQQDLKWTPEWRQIYFVENLALSAKEGDFDLVVWPENAVTWALNDVPNRRLEIAQAALGKPVLVGGYHYVGRDYFNTLALLDEGGLVRHYYDKHHLVPFGEYPPLVGLWERLGFGEVLPPYWTPGARPETVRREGVPAYLPLICYETIFPRYSNAGEDRPEWIVQVTNDAWFGNFSGPYQHLAQVRMRAIEQGLPIARAANTGVSAIVDAKGRILAESPLNERAVLDFELPVADQPSFYSRAGNWTAWSGLILLIIAACAPLRRS